MPAWHCYALVIKTARRALLGDEEVGGLEVAVHDVGVVQVAHPAQRLAGGGTGERFTTVQGRAEQ